MTNRIKGPVVLIASCAAIFWPGAFIFSFPGIMAQYWQTTFDVGRGAIGQTLFFVLAAVGIFMFLTGRWQEKIGPACLTATGGVLCGMSTIIVGHATSMNHVYLWAFLVGASSSFIYIPVITVVQQWYPLRRGLVSGVVSMVFGLSAAIMSPIFSQMLHSLGYPGMTLILGLVALVMGLVAAPFVQSPKIPDLPVPGPTAVSPGPVLSLTVAQSLRTRAFWLLWFTWALAGAAGIAMVTLSTSFGISRGLSIKDAVLILTAFNLTNGLGRLASGYLSDLFGRHVTMTLAFLGAGCAYLLLPVMEVLVSWAVLAAIVGFAFGTLFAVSAPLASDCFGMRHFGAIFGLVFTAYGFIAGALGPWLSGYLLDATEGNFTLVFICLAIYCFTSAILIRYAKPPRHTVSARCG